MLETLASAKRQSRKREILPGVFVLVLLTFLGMTGWLAPLDSLFTDLHFKIRGDRAFSEEVVLIGVDEASLDVFGRWPWSRDKHAALIRLLDQDVFRPAVLGYDLLFEQRNSAHEAGDEALVEQAANWKDAIVMAYFFEKGAGASVERSAEKETYLESFAFSPESVLSLPEAIEEADKVSLPFLDLTRHVDLAFVNTPIDVDGRTRRAQLLMKYRDKIYPSMDLLAAMRVLGTRMDEVLITRDAVIFLNSRRGRIVIPVNRRGEMLIDYYGSAAVIPSYSFVEVLDEGRSWMEGGAVPESLRSFKDRAVLVGVTALGLGDRRVTPLEKYETGLSLHAQAIANILQGDFLREAPFYVTGIALWALGLFVIAATMYLRITWALPAVGLAGAACFILAHVLFRYGIVLRATLPEIGILLTFTGMLSYRYFTALEELKRTQAQLVHSAKLAALGQLSAGTAHEFRNILSAISLNIEYCGQENVSAERISQGMTRMRGILAHAHQILNGLLIFARKSESVKQPGRLKQTLENAVSILEQDLLMHEIQLVRDACEDVPEMMYDAGQISQVLINLISNARDALEGRPNKKIVLTLKGTAGGALLQVSDNGKGILPNVMKDLFQPFVTTKPAGQGTGLGLAICHGIIRNHGGDIRVTSTPGSGTTWHITLPAA